eukprot:3648010-Alexandrium_andersonii.AAC.1
MTARVRTTIKFGLTWCRRGPAPSARSLRLSLPRWSPTDWRAMFAWCQRSSTTISIVAKLSPGTCRIPAAAASRWQ